MATRVYCKRIFALILCAVICLSSTITTLADTLPGGSGHGGTYNPGPTNPNYNPDYSSFLEFGYRVTITSPKPITDSGNLGKLPEKFTVDDLNKQFDDIAKLSTERYWDPGPYGLNFYSGKSNMGTVRFLATGTGSKINPYYARGILLSGAEPNTQLNNDLAFMLWDTPDGWNRTPNVPAYNAELAKLFTGEGARGYDSASWFEAVKQYYSPDSAEAQVKQLMGNGNGPLIAKAFPYFTWSSRSDIADPGNAYQKVLWSRIGLVATDVQFAMAAEKIGDAYTANAMRDAIYTWVASDYESSNMAILEVECTHANNVDGNPQGSVDFITLPASVFLAYPNTGAEELLYSEWPDDVKGDTNKAIAWVSTGHKATKIGIGALRQGISGYGDNGTWVDMVPKKGPRNYLKQVTPYANVPGAYGYFVNWTYWVDDVPPPDIPTTDKHETMGSFTWKLTPDGMHDKTPATEVNESSTIYELNISQDKFNANNYAQWKTAVYGDGVDCNKLRIRIYHVSENLAEEQAATKYARDAVKQKGADVTTPINKVTVSPTGNITGFPAGTITELHNNTWSESLTDEQFLKIMKEGDWPDILFAYVHFSGVEQRVECGRAVLKPPLFTGLFLGSLGSNPVARSFLWLEL